MNQKWTPELEALFIAHQDSGQTDIAFGLEHGIKRHSLSDARIRLGLPLRARARDHRRDKSVERIREAVRPGRPRLRRGWPPCEGIWYEDDPRARG